MRGLTFKLVATLAALQVLMGALHPLTAFAGQAGRRSPQTAVTVADHCYTHVGGQAFGHSHGRDLGHHHCCDSGQCQCSGVAIAVSDLRVAPAAHGAYRCILPVLLLPTRSDDFLRPPID